MTNHIIPCYQFPTTVVFIDDNKDFIKSASLCVSEDNISYRFFSNPLEALDFLNAHQADSCSHHYMHSVLPQKTGQQTIDLDVQQLYQEVYNPNRFNRIATVITDYDMPEMDGVTFCKKIQSLDVTRVLLTAAADEHLAVQAFNEGCINQFLQKQQENIFFTINNLVKESQTQYFQKLSSVFHKSIANRTELVTAINDPVFIRLFELLTTRHNIVEYYLLETVGSFLMFDEDGQDYTLVIQSEDQIQANYLEVENEPESVYSAKLKEEIRLGNQIVCFPFSQDRAYPPTSDWQLFLHPASKLMGTKTYSYALLSGNMSLDKGKMLTFKDFKIKKMIEAEAACFV